MWLLWTFIEETKPNYYYYYYYYYSYYKFVHVVSMKIFNCALHKKLFKDGK